MQLRKRTDFIVIHCSATGPNADIGRAEIDQWHKARGWTGIGYHYVIRRDGTVESGRKENSVGAHAQGVNSTSIGICLVGGVNAKGHPDVNYTPAQWDALDTLVSDLKYNYLNAQVIGHRDVPGTKKDCPCFDVAQWFKTRNPQPTSRAK